MSKQWLVDERGGYPFVGNVEIRTNYADGRLEPDVARTLGLDTDRVQGSAQHYRLRRCMVCPQRFVGWHSQRTCSDACRAAIYQRVLDAAKAKRLQRRQAREARVAAHKAERESLRGSKPPMRCEACGKPMEVKRRSKRFCDAACRQRDHRQRRR